MKNQGQNRRNTQAGNVLFIILICIVLFAALSLALSQGLRGGSASMGTEQTRLAATEILQFANKMKTAVQTAMINGCTDIQISFESAATGSTYTNTNTPPDTCKIFYPNGGGLTHIEPPAYGMPKNAAYATNRYAFIGRSGIQGVGTGVGELYMWLRTRSKELCMEYNKLVGVTNAGDDAPEDGGVNGSPRFTGTYSAGTTVSAGGALTGKLTGCYKDGAESDTDGQRFYDIYQVLIAR